MFSKNTHNLLGLLAEMSLELMTMVAQHWRLLGGLYCSADVYSSGDTFGQNILDLFRAYYSRGLLVHRSSDLSYCLYDWLNMYLWSKEE